MPEYNHTHRVADHGDPTVINLSAISTNTDVVLPDGDVTLQGQLAVGWGSLRFRAADGASPTLALPRGHNEFAVRFSGDHFVWQDIDIDVSDGVTGMQIISPEFRIENVTFHGRGTHPARSVTSCFSVSVTDPDGVGVIKNSTALKGSAWARYKGGNGRHFLWVGKRHVGTLYVRDCQVEEFGNNGIYGSAAEGPIIVENCEFWNNNVASLRFGSEGCAVRNTTVGVDPERYSGPREPTYEGHAFYLRCIWNEAKVGALNSPGRVAVENSRILVHGDESDRLPTGGTGVRIRPNGTALDLIDTDIEVTARNVPPIVAARPDATPTHARPDGPTDIDLRRTRIVSHAPVSELIGVQGRDLRVRDNCHLEGKADGTRGVVVEQGGRIRAFENSTVNVRGDTVIPTDTDTSSIDTETVASGSWPPTEDEKDSPETGIDPLPDPEPQPSGPNEFIQYIDPMKLTIKTDGDSPIGHRLVAAGDSELSVASDPEGDRVTTSDGRDVAIGTVYPGGGDSYELTGALAKAEATSGDQQWKAYALIDGEHRVPLSELAKETLAIVGEDMGEVFADARYQSD